MAESQLPLENVDGPATPAPPGDVSWSEGGVADAPSAPAAASPHEEPADAVAAEGDPAPAETPEQAPVHFPELNGSWVDHAAAQPHLDAEAAQGPDVSEAAPQIPPVEPALSPEPQEPAEPALPLALDPAPPNWEPPPEAFAAAHPETSDAPQEHVPPPAEILMEVSPIFNALDAAEEAAAEAERNFPPAVEADDDVIALAHAPALDEPQPEAPAPAADAESDAAPFAEPPIETVGASTALADEPEPDTQLHDAAVKIAEEASATAAALESLKRLLDHKLPLLDPVPAPPPLPLVEHAPAPIPMPPALPPIPAYRASPRPVAPPPMIPLTPAPEFPLPPVRAQARLRSSVSGFLAGFALSWVIGAILYAYLAVMG